MQRRDYKSIFQMSKDNPQDNKNSFIFYEDWLKAIESLQEELRLEMFSAIARYALYGEEPKNPNIALIMNFVRQTIDRNAEKYAGRCESNRINGGIGGKKRAENLAKKKLEEQQANQANATNSSETKQMLQIQATQANQADNDNDNDNVNDNVENNNTSTDVDVSQTKKPTALEQKIAEYWKKVTNLKELRLPFAPQCLSSVRARIKMYGENSIYEAIDKIAESKFLNGNNNRGWTVTFGWLVKPNNFPKVLQGDYSDNEQPAVSGLKSQDTTVQTKKEYSKDF